MQSIPFVTFRDFGQILATVKAIVAGELGVKEAAKGRID
jgi:hypothetical protein